MVDTNWISQQFVIYSQTQHELDHYLVSLNMIFHHSPPIYNDYNDQTFSHHRFDDF